MKPFLFSILALALLQIAKTLPCLIVIEILRILLLLLLNVAACNRGSYFFSIGDSCGRHSQLFSEYDDDDGLFYIREGSHNSASSNNDDNNDEQPENQEDSGFEFAFLDEHQDQQQHPNHQRLSKNYQQSIEPNTPDQAPYQSNQQPTNPLASYDENQKSQYRPNPSPNNRNNYKSRNLVGNGSQNQDKRAGSNGYYPGSNNQGGGGGRYQNNGDGYNGQYPDSGNQGGRGGGYYQNNGGYYGRYNDRQSSCPNCYATGFGNGENNKNIINIEK